MKTIAIGVLFGLVFPLSIQASSDFDKWKKQFSLKASKKGLNSKFVLNQLESVSYKPKIIEKDRNQLTSDSSINYPSFIDRWLSSNPPRVNKGKELLSENRELLEQIEKKYSVDKEAIVSLWGVETLYGNITGDYDIVSVLSTLAYDKRRRSFFEKELMAALTILKEGHIDRENFKGSWAGAMGQCQFMPTSFLMYAQDFDGDGKKDIWKNKKDLFASMAYYLKRAGWKKNKEIGLLATKKGKVNFNHKKMRRPSQYNKLGLRTLDGKKLQGNWRRKIALIPHKNSPLVLRGSNYRAIMRWNRSSLFAALNILLMEEFKKN
tara:strand:- start:63879 stop:64841 length:963 start_codon:yes stop_codon:yes gene_type:complete